MKALILLLASLFAVGAYASETPYFYCVGTSPDFANFFVKQVVTNDGGGTISSTFKLDVTDHSGTVTAYWQDGDVMIGSDDTFKGPFKAGTRVVQVDIKGPTFPDYNPRESTLTDGATVHKMNCSSL